MDKKKYKFTDFFSALFLLFLGCFFLTFLSLKPTETGPIALWFGADISRAEQFKIISGLGGTIVRSGGSDHLLVANFQNRPDMASFRGNGIYLVLSPIVAGACDRRDQQ